MAKKLRVLIVEDSENDALLVLREIQRGGYEVESERVERAEQMRSALDWQAWDLIICDYSLPEFGAQQALAILKESGHDLPFLIVSGTIGEQRAVASMKEGAHDFVLKDNLARLIPAIERELKEAINRRERREAEEQLRATQARLAGILKIAADAIIVVDSDQKVTMFNEGAENIFGYRADEVVGKPLDLLIPPRFTRVHKQHIQEFSQAPETSRNMAKRRAVFGRRKDGSEFPAEGSISKLQLGNETTYIAILRDISERKNAEKRLRESEANLAEAQRITHLGSWELDLTNLEDVNANPLSWSDEVFRIFGYEPGEIEVSNENFFRAVHPEDRSRIEAAMAEALKTRGDYSLHHRIIRPDGVEAIVNELGEVVTDAQGRPLRVVGTVQDVTERKKAEATLSQRERELEQSNVEITRLYRASEALLVGSLADLPSLARTIVLTVLREFEQSNCSLLLVNTETRSLDRLAVGGPYAEEVARAELSLDQPGLVAKAIRSGQVLNVPDVTADPDYVPGWRLARSELVIPLKIGEEVIGALDVQSMEPSAFRTDDERLMTVFSERAALALERTKLYEQTQKQLKRMEGLRTIDLAISSSFDLRLSLNIVLEQVVLQLGVDAASVLLLTPGGARLEYAAGKGFRTREIESTSLRMGEGYAGQSALEKKTLHIENLQSNGNMSSRRQLITTEEFISYSVVPLMAKGEIKGVLEVFNRSLIRPDAEWLDFLDALGWQTAIAVDNATLFEGMQRSNVELALAYDATIEGWSNALDLRDKETEGHTRRVAEMTLKLAQIMGFREDQRVHIRRGALLHDIGKMGVPDKILHKPAKLNKDEWRIMKQHPQLAYDLLAPIAYLRQALDIPFCHHEKWDGSGYPRGLSGTQIPLESRLFAVVDVWDAITSDRPYRRKWPKSKALKYIREERGKHFDPAAVDVFLREIIK